MQRRGVPIIGQFSVGRVDTFLERASGAQNAQNTVNTFLERASGAQNTQNTVKLVLENVCPFTKLLNEGFSALY